MAIHLIESTCGGNRDCPHVNADVDAGQWIVVGYATDRVTVVELPAGLAPEWADRFPGRDGRLLVSGSAVTDEATLMELDLDPGEAALRLPFGAVPMLGAARSLVGV